MTLSPGARLGPYEILSPLGAGGMGEVYRARDTKLGRDVALKLLPSEFTHDSDRVARFQREAQVLASLNHPHIGAIHGLEDANGVTALVLELVEGPTLADRVARGPIPFDEALPIAKQIAEALEAAHEQGIIHRDLKPANIKVREDGTVKVLDFGLAKLADPVGTGIPTGPSVTQSPTITTPAMTAAGMILGTAAYMSPEQAKGRAVDKRSDVWAFGCVLFEMLTGHRAFAGDDVSDTLAAVLRGEPEWSTLPRGVPVSVRTLIQRCLVKDWRQRAADIAVARFVLADPNALAQSLDAPTALPEPRRRSRWQTIGALGAAIAVTAIVVGAAERMWQPASPVHAVMRARFSLPPGQLLSNLGRHALAISPDGTKMAYFAGGRLFLRGLSEFEGHEIGVSETGLVDPVFSPDGRSIAFQSAGAIRRIAVTGGAAVTICPAETTYGMSWDAEAGLVFGQGAKGVLRCPENGGSPEQLLAVKPQELAYGPQLLPGGRALLLTIANTADGPARWDKARIVVQPLPSGQPTTLISGGTDARYLPTGHLVYQFGGVVFATPFDTARLAVSGGPVSVVEGVRGSASKFTGAAQFAISQDGTLLYIPGPVGTASDVGSIAFADRGGTVTPLSLPPRAYTHVRASRDGTRLAIGTDDGRDAIVWIDDLKASAAMRRLTLVGHNRFPIWSPDGQRVAYQSDRDGDVGIFVQRAEGAGEAERLTKPGEGEVHIPESWSPDGKYLAFSVAKGGWYAISMLSLDDRKVAPFGDLQSSEPMGPVFSPDGAWVAYYVNPGDAGSGAPTNANRGIFVQPFPFTPERYQVPNQRLDFQPVWTSNGKELIYVPSAGSGTLAVIGVTTHPTVTFSRPVLIPARVTGGLLSISQRAYDILPDGRFVGLTSPSDAENTSPNGEILVVSNWFTELQQRVPTR